MNENEKEAEFNAAVAQIEAQTVQIAPKISTWGYLFWSLAIPPLSTFAAMYFAWKKGVLHKLMPNMAILYSVLFAFWSLLMFSAPKAFGDYFGQRVVGVALFDKLEATVLEAVGIGAGIYFRNRGKKEDRLSAAYERLFTLILVLQFFVGWHQLSLIGGVVNQVQDTGLGL